MAPSREPLLTPPFLMAGLANLMHGLALHSYLHLPGYLEDLGATPTMVGIVFGFMSGTALFIRPFAGRVMDGAGRRVVILAAGVMHLSACALYLTVDAIGPWIFFVRGLQGFASGAMFSSLFTFAADIVPASRRTEGMGLFGVSGMLPISLGGLLGDFVLARGSYHDLFLVSVGITTAALLVSLPLKEPARPRGANVVARGFFDALGQRDLLPIWFVGSAMATALAAAFSFLKNYVEHEQIGTVGTFFSFYAGTAIALRVFLGWLPDRVGAKKVFYPAMASIGAAMATLALASDVVGIAVAGVFAGLGHGFAFPILSALTVTRANPGDRGSAVSLFTAVFDAGILLGGFLFGPIAGEERDYRTMYAVAAVIPVASTVVFHLWDRAVPPVVEPDR
ncbi:MAG TPA: MFS transporter [Sandaracinaceae bacterium LLY-WYZ-13_1]|nr:MFS transporter [Sandaracinaceae bacterium LLY-WYZ-13_1]